MTTDQLRAVRRRKTPFHFVIPLFSSSAGVRSLVVEKFNVTIPLAGVVNPKLVAAFAMYGNMDLNLNGVGHLVHRKVVGHLAHRKVVGHLALQMVVQTVSELKLRLVHQKVVGHLVHQMEVDHLVRQRVGYHLCYYQIVSELKLRLVHRKVVGHLAHRKGVGHLVHRKVVGHLAHRKVVGHLALQMVVQTVSELKLRLVHQKVVGHLVHQMEVDHLVRQRVGYHLCYYQVLAHLVSTVYEGAEQKRNHVTSSKPITRFQSNRRRSLGVT
uniref:Uncharacterized protein n=1 Tax=Timema bartmani TaxID=61472 RepID=A0A7R9EZF9_9NEOP|nr:unnamed protein product [Timema bartmani]